MSLNVHVKVNTVPCGPPLPWGSILTLQELGHKVGGCLGLLDSISLHDSALLVQAHAPGPARTTLAIESRGVQDIVILKDALLKATLSCEMWLRRQRPRKAHTDRNTKRHITEQKGALGRTRQDIIHMFETGRANF